MHLGSGSFNPNLDPLAYSPCLFLTVNPVHSVKKSPFSFGLTLTVCYGLKKMKANSHQHKPFL
ncbi:MAG: hypothetical protein A2Y79_02765 [Deltaproteobacteria bacterium RBG_13_43_22]|nr:MAG: hypothetical protein A2Y79_02765 [Deltaproteobacteria bacterium RBG_13_43_22]